MEPNIKLVFRLLIMMESHALGLKTIIFFLTNIFKTPPIFLALERLRQGY